MIIAQLTGGLGNQMFQYAAAKSLSLHHKTTLLLDISSYCRDEIPELEVPRSFELSNFKGVDEEILNVNVLAATKEYDFLRNRILQKFLPNYKKGIYREPYFHYDANFYKSRSSVYLKGGWQSFKYFKNYSKIISSIFQLQDNVIENVKDLATDYESQNTVSIHIRRGDYLRKPVITEWHGVLGRDYYINAFEQLTKQKKIDKVLYFSDEPEWVIKELLPDIPGEIVSSKFATNQYEDFYLMSRCRNNIIANSSFSWWAAYLNPNPEKIVVAPERWFNKAPYNTKDLIPESWIRI